MLCINQHFYKKPRCRGLTLVELLVVVGIIGALMAMFLAFDSGIEARKRNTVARAELDIIAQALEQFKLKYGDYPWIQFGNTAQGNTPARFYEALTGEAQLVISATAVNVEAVTGSTGPSLIDTSKMSLDPTSPFLVDPWGNPYEYYYIPNGTAPVPNDEFALWKSKSFVLLSLGADGAQETSDAITDMYTEGKMMNAKAYFESGTEPSITI